MLHSSLVSCEDLGQRWDSAVGQIEDLYRLGKQGDSDGMIRWLVALALVLVAAVPLPLWRMRREAAVEARHAAEVLAVMERAADETRAEFARKEAEEVEAEAARGRRAAAFEEERRSEAMAAEVRREVERQLRMEKLQQEAEEAKLLLRQLEAEREAQRDIEREEMNERARNSPQPFVWPEGARPPRN